MLVLALLAACEADKPQPVDAGSNYFPLKAGVYQIYDVQEVNYAPNVEAQVTTYQLKMQVADSFATASGGITYVIYRSTRDEESGEWHELDTWSARKDDEGVVVMEGNTPFVKLAFPVRAGIRWNGNAMNNLGDDEYELKDVGVPLQVGGTTFEETATVEQERNDDPVVFRDERSEVYASGVGLIMRKVTQLHYCTDDACLGQQVVDYGVELTMQIKEYGR